MSNEEFDSKRKNNMKNLIHMYMHSLHDEKDAFWDYIELIDCESHKEHKALWIAIATDELQHFQKIKDAIWADMESHTDMEKAFYHTMHDEYEKMKKCLEKRK